MRRPLSLVIAAVTLAALGGCTGNTVKPRATPTTSVAATELASLATAGLRTTWAATYLFHLAKPSSTAIVKVWHAPPSLRIDVISGTTTATLIITASASYSCGVKAKRRACFRVAGPGQPIPAPFDIGPASLFSTDLETFSRSGATYVVATTAPTAGSTRVLATHCLTVAPGILSPSPQVQPGTYCFADNGVLTAVTYASGNTAQLTAVSYAVAPANFRPYAHPAPLPS